MSTALVVRFVFWIWILGAIALAYSGTLARMPLPVIPVFVFGLTAVLVLAYRKIIPFRNWLDELDIRALVSLHITRFVGVYFLVLYQRGELPHAFAVPGGVGDIAVAVAAIAILLIPMSDERRLRMISIWNVVGLVDILLVISTAARLVWSGSQELRAMTYLPLSLLPTFLVPLIVAGHIAIYARIRRTETPG